MGNLNFNSSNKSNKIRNKIAGLFNLLICQVIILLMVVTSTYAIYKDGVIIDGHSETISWCFSSDKLSTEGNEYTLVWNGQVGSPITFTFDVGGEQGGDTTDIAIPYNIVTQSSAGLRTNVTVNQSSGTIAKNSSTKNTHTVTITNNTANKLTGSFNVTVKAVTDSSCPVSEELSAVIHVYIPTLLEYSIVDAAGNENAQLIIQTFESETDYINANIYFDSESVATPTFSGSGQYAQVYYDGLTGSSMVMTLRENSSYVLSFKKADPTEDYNGTENDLSAVIKVVANFQSNTVTFNPNDT
ncbi:MAG: hypothetical protein J5689_00315, partial [Clostridia bacterium]|nr:hypothetical protein [Clostridia bacterium]